MSKLSSYANITPADDDRLVTTDDSDANNTKNVLVSALRTFLHNAAVFTGISEFQGNVGIGTSSPATPLHVSGGASDSKVLLTNNTVGNTASDGGQVSMGSGGNLTLENFEAQNIILRNNGAERLRIDSTGSVGIGTSSPKEGLHMHKSSAATASQMQFTNGDTTDASDSGVEMGLEASGSGFFWNRENNYLRFGTNNAERLRIDSTGSVGIGTSSPAADLHVHDGASDAIIKLTNGTSGETASDGADIFFQNSTNDLVLLNRESANLRMLTDNTERLRVDSSGNVLVGKTVTATSTAGVALFPNGQGAFTRDSASGLVVNRLTDDGDVAVFQQDSSIHGSISIAGSTTSYNTSSDYRLKENVEPLTGATERILSLKPSRFNFISSPDRIVDGFIAHEVQEVIPEAVQGTKDAMKEEEYIETPAVMDGEEIVTPAVMGTREVEDYQGIDQAKIVPLLVATIQELEARISVLENN